MNSEQKATFISQIYVYLVEQLRKTLNYVIKNGPDSMHEDIVIQQEMILKERQKIMQSLAKESKSDYYFRLAKEYEIIGDFHMSNKNYQNMISTNERNDKFYEIYSKFLIRNKNYSDAEICVNKAMSLNGQNVEYKKLKILLLVNRQRYDDALKILKQLLAGNRFNMLYNLLASFIYQQKEDDLMSNKHLQVIQRLIMRQNGILPNKQPPKYNINPFKMPDIKALVQQQEEYKKLPELTDEQSNSVQMEMIEFFADCHMFGLVEKAIELISD